MLNPNEAEIIAQDYMQKYVNECKCDTKEDVANVLMKLMSMCALGMCATVGKNDAVERIRGTAAYIETTQAGKNWQVEKSH